MIRWGINVVYPAHTHFRSNRAPSDSGLKFRDGKLYFGFAQIELMFVVGITGILAIIAIPQYQTYVSAEVTGTAIAAASSSAVKQSGGVDYGTPWEWEFADKGSTACWDQTVADKATDGNGWVVGLNMVEETEWLTQYELRTLATADKGYSQRRMRSLTPELHRLLGKCVGEKET